MRWIFLSLLLANIGVYIWHSMSADRQARLEQLNTSALSDATVRGRPLVLISELSEEERQELAKHPREDVVTDAVVPVVAPVVVATQAPAEEETQASVSEPAPAIAVAAPAVVPNQCLMFGPVTDKQSNQIIQRLLARAIVPEERVVEAKGSPEYWVVLPPFEDEKAAIKKLQEIQGRGMEAQIIAKGELANAISFGGILSQKAEAQQLVEKLRAKGLKVEVRSLPRTYREKWVNLSERQTPKLDEGIWQELKRDFPNLKKENYRCH